jgi:hypothetical protein
MSSVVIPPDTDPNTKPTESAAPAGADEEPQNALTQKFTEKEWAALKEFRVRLCHPQSRSRVSFFAHSTSLQPVLPDILEQAYKGKEGARDTPVVIWGVTLDPSGKKDARASVLLMKWLRAR